MASKDRDLCAVAAYDGVTEALARAGRHAADRAILLLGFAGAFRQGLGLGQQVLLADLDAFPEGLEVAEVAEVAKVAKVAMLRGVPLEVARAAVLFAAEIFSQRAHPDFAALWERRWPRWIAGQLFLDVVPSVEWVLHTQAWVAS